jgi:hypothetical protein
MLLRTSTILTISRSIKSSLSKQKQAANEWISHNDYITTITTITTIRTTKRNKFFSPEAYSPITPSPGSRFYSHTVKHHNNIERLVL